MCLMIHRPKGSPRIAPGWLDDFRTLNSDGFGAWWIDRERREIVVVKTRDKAAIEPIVRSIEARDLEAGMHWRMATHGAVDLSNVHPYDVALAQDGRRITALAHNGVLGTFAPRNQGAKNDWIGPSDTAIFIEEALKPIIAGFGLKALYTANSIPREFCEELLGYSNKLLLTNLRYGFSRVSGRGEWTKWRGLWLSNTYAWSASQREREDGPLSAVVPFPPYVASNWAGEDTESYLWDYAKKNDARSSEFGETAAGLTAKALLEAGATYLDNASLGLMPLAGGEPRMVRCGPTREIPYVHWIYTDAAGKAVRMDYEDAKTLAAASHTCPPAKPSLAALDEAELRQQLEREAASARTAPKRTLGDRDATIEVLASMSYAEIAEWCQEEPEEAALIIQAFAWEFGK